MAVPISAGWARFADSQHLVLGRDEVKVKVRSARLGREITIQGFGVRVRLREGSGQEFNSYFAVFPEEPQCIKFRVTYPSGQRVQGTIDDFVKQVLEARRRARALL